MYTCIFHELFFVVVREKWGETAERERREREKGGKGRKPSPQIPQWLGLGHG